MSDVLPSLELALLLGLRHGLAPDHLAAIDGLTMRAAARAAPWMGALFALGHGLVMLTVVTAAGAAAAATHPGHAMLSILDAIEWLPGVFLLGLALLNARGLLAKAPAAARPPAAAALPEPGAGVLAGLGVGMLFALGADSVLQSLTWGYAATTLGGVGAALQVAAAFIIGMTLTDALDGFAAARISRVSGPQAMRTLRRRLGWPIVVLCTVSGVQLLAAKVCDSCEANEHWLSMLGAVMIGVTVCLYLGLYIATLLRALRLARSVLP